MCDLRSDSRFQNIERFSKKIWLASPTMHGEELSYMEKAYESNWMSTVGENIDVIERQISEYVGVPYGAALTCGTAALHLAVKLAAERLYGSSTGIRTPEGKGGGGALCGKRVFCSDLTFAATVSPVVYEGGEPVFIDSEYETWNMDPAALEKAFEIWPDVRLVVLVHLYGTPARAEEIRRICDAHDALLIEDAAESLGAAVGGRQTGSFGDYSVVSFNGNKIITGSSGGMLLVWDQYSAGQARKWSTQSREAAPWYEHEELGYNYRISNVVAGVVRGQFGHLAEHIEAKKKIYERYREGLKDLPVFMNPYRKGQTEPNFWLSCLLIDECAMCECVRSGREKLYLHEKGKSCPDEILDALAAFDVEGRPIWKPMHMQPLYRQNGFVTAEGCGGGTNGAYREAGDGCRADAAADLFQRGVCLPSDVKMTEEDQERVIEIVRRCFL